jgi:methionyl-tRNA formyltransferase
MLPTWLLEWQEFAERSRTPLAGVEHRKITVQKQPKVSPTPYAALLKRDDGFLPWSTITKSLQGQTLQADDFPNKHMLKAIFFSESKVLSAEPDPADAAGSRALQNFDSKKFSLFLSRLPRAFATYPSLWTIVSTTKGDKRMKILSFSPFMVQIEGGQPTVYHQIKNQLK